jgi:hypothetical protein
MAYTNLESCCFKQLNVEILGVLDANVDNIKRGDACNNISIGTNALCSNLCSNAVCNIAIGINSLCSFVSASCNALILGTSANTSVGIEGFSCLVCGGYNTNLGAGNAPIMVCGDYNTIVGTTNLYFSSESFVQVAVGSQVLQNWCGVGGTGRNIGIGFSALKGELTACGGMTGERNIGIGLNSGLRLRGANTNILIGGNSGYVSDVDGCYLKNGCWNVILGHHSGRGLVDGNYNTLIGNCIGKVVPIGDVSNSVIISDGCGCIKFETNSCNQVKIGNNSGVNTCLSSGSNFIGDNSGYNACCSSHSNFIGTCAGYCSYNSHYSNFIGFSAGGCFFSGFSACSFEICNSNFIGTCAGIGSCCVSFSNFIGNDSGRRATSSSNSNFIGNSAGFNSTCSLSSNFIGSNAGREALNSSHSNFIGMCAGFGAHCSNNSNFIGNGTGDGGSNGAYCSSNSNFIGTSAGYDAYNSSNSNFIGINAGYGAYCSSGSNFIGNGAGYNLFGCPDRFILGNNPTNYCIVSCYATMCGNLSTKEMTFYGDIATQNTAIRIFDGSGNYTYLGPNIISSNGGSLVINNCFSVTTDGRIYGAALHNNAGAVTGTVNQYIASGTYTPTATGVANTSVITTNLSNWMRVGNVVTVSGIVEVSTTSASTSTAFYITLPVASELVSAFNTAGTAISNTLGSTMAIYADTANNTAIFQNSGGWTTTASISMIFTFTYVIL